MFCFNQLLSCVSYRTNTYKHNDAGNVIFTLYNYFHFVMCMCMFSLFLLVKLWYVLILPPPFLYVYYLFFVCYNIYSTRVFVYIFIVHPQRCLLGTQLQAAINYVEVSISPSSVTTNSSLSLNIQANIGKASLYHIFIHRFTMLADPHIMKKEDVFVIYATHTLTYLLTLSF